MCGIIAVSTFLGVDGVKKCQKVLILRVKLTTDLAVQCGCLV